MNTFQFIAQKNELDVVPASSLLKSGTPGANIEFIDGSVAEDAEKVKKCFSDMERTALYCRFVHIGSLRRGRGPMWASAPTGRVHICGRAMRAPTDTLKAENRKL